jgi:hypothetical protein
VTQSVRNEIAEYSLDPALIGEEGQARWHASQFNLSRKSSVASAYPLDEVTRGDGSRPHQQFPELDSESIKQVLLSIGDLSQRRLYRR